MKLTKKAKQQIKSNMNSSNTTITPKVKVTQYFFKAGDLVSQNPKDIFFKDYDNIGIIMKDPENDWCRVYTHAGPASFYCKRIRVIQKYEGEI